MKRKREKKKKLTHFLSPQNLVRERERGEGAGGRGEGGGRECTGQTGDNLVLAL